MTKVNWNSYKSIVTTKNADFFSQPHALAEWSADQIVVENRNRIFLFIVKVQIPEISDNWLAFDYFLPNHIWLILLSTTFSIVQKSSIFGKNTTQKFKFPASQQKIEISTGRSKQHNVRFLQFCYNHFPNFLKGFLEVGKC